MAPLDELTVWRGLVELVQAEVLYGGGVPPQATYTFKHALLQEAAYQSLLKSTRQQYHQHIAQVLAAQFPAFTETQPELLAHHYTDAGHRRDSGEVLAAGRSKSPCAGGLCRSHQPSHHRPGGAEDSTGHH